MSMQSRITAALQAIGADIKALQRPTEQDLGTVTGAVTLAATAPYKRRCVVSGSATFTPAAPAHHRHPSIYRRDMAGRYGACMGLGQCRGARLRGGRLDR